MKGLSIAGIVFCGAGVAILFIGAISAQKGGSIIPQYITITAILAGIGAVFAYLSKWRRRNGNNNSLR